MYNIYSYTSEVLKNLNIGLMFRSIILLVFLLHFFSGCSSHVDSIHAEVIDVANPTKSGARYPYLHTSSNGLSMSWLQQLDSTQYALQVSTFYEGKWGNPEIVVSSDQFFVNWADFPSLVTYNGRVIAAHWLQKVEGGTYAYHVKISFRNSDGTWSQAITPHTDNTPTEHGFVSLLALDEDHILAVWLDGRNTSGSHHDSHDQHSGHGASDLTTAMTLRSAVVAREGSLSYEQEIDSAVCDCCQTSLVATPTGAMVIYRNRSEKEIRDIAISRYDLGNHSWSKPEILHDDGWNIEGCPVNGPRLASKGNSIVATWFTVDGETPVIKAKRSDDGGQSFGRTHIIDKQSVGRVDVVLDDERNAWISWIGKKEGESHLALRRLSDRNQLSDVFLVSGVSEKRSSGFPRMIWTDQKMYMALTDPENGMKIKFLSIDF